MDIYLSEFGRQRIEEEDRLGPTELRRWKEQQEEGIKEEEEEDFTDLAKSSKKVSLSDHFCPPVNVIFTRTVYARLILSY